MFFSLISVDKFKKYRNTHLSYNEFGGNFFLRYHSNDFISSFLSCFIWEKMYWPLYKIAYIINIVGYLSSLLL